MIKKVKWIKCAGMAIWPFVFINEKYTSNVDATINHEKIHLEQQKEMLLVFFYIWYLVELIFRGYKNISFEREGYLNRTNLTYLSKRKRYAWIKYL